MGIWREATEPAGFAIAMSTINVNSIGSLEELETSLARFAAETKEAVASIQRQIQAKTELLSQLVIDRRRAVAELREEYHDADDEEERREIRRKLQEAEEELREAHRWQRRVEDVCADFKKHLHEASRLADGHADRSRMFLKARIKDLHRYVGLKPRSSQTDAGTE